MSEEPPQGHDDTTSWVQTDDGQLDEPPRRTRMVVYAVLAVLVLMIVAGVIGYVASLQAAPKQPIEVVTSLQAPLQLPLQAGTLARDPNKGLNPSTDPDTKVLSQSATYNRDGKATVIVVASRPVTDAQKLLQDAGAQAVRPVGDGFCGRTSEDYDACTIVRGNTAVLGVALADQTPEELMAEVVSVSEAIG